VQVTGRRLASSAAKDVPVATSKVTNTQLVSPYELLAMGTKVKKKLVRSSEECKLRITTMPCSQPSLMVSSFLDFQSRLDRLQDNVDRIIQTRLEATRRETEAVLQKNLDAIRLEMDLKSKTIQQLEERQSLLSQRVLDLESVTKRPLNALHASQVRVSPLFLGS
jgi:hypothetical protein